MVLWGGWRSWGWLGWLNKCSQFLSQLKLLVGMRVVVLDNDGSVLTTAWIVNQLGPVPPKVVVPVSAAGR